MKIAVSLDKDGMLPDRFGKLSPESLRRGGINFRSFPIAISDVPAGAKSLALSFVDFDSIPVCGFAWIHWTACDIDPATTLVPENASHSGEFPFTQGSNSCTSRADETSEEVIRGYIGPCPPDKDHTYTLTVYALDCELGLKSGFLFNEFYWALQGHVMDKATLNIPSRA